MGRSRIPYLTDTWSPITGCTPVGEGCRNCWAQEVLTRFSSIHEHTDPHKIQIHDERLTEPGRWKRPRVVGVCFFSDLFHEHVPEYIVQSLFYTMRMADSRHTFVILTKRPKRMHKVLSHEKDIPANIVLGVSVWDQASTAVSLTWLRQTGGQNTTRILSIEPMLGPIDLRSVDTTGLSGIILGGESGRVQAVTELDPQWVRDVQKVCAERGIRFYFKQWSGARAKEHPCLLDGVEYKELPEIMKKERKSD
ncbi:MAG: DUF5131 family protein [Patescibacteria group bacterium]